MLTNRFSRSVILLMIVGTLSCGVEPVDTNNSATLGLNQKQARTVAVLVPGMPSGIFINQSNLPAISTDPVKIGRIDTYILSSTTCSGTNLVIPWNKVNTADGVYNWGYVMNEARKWWDAGKQVNLLFWSCAETKTQQFGSQNNERMIPQ